MGNFKLTIEYAGTNYHGWQRQATGYRRQVTGPKTIQGEIEKALKKIFGKKIHLIGSGRTDSGVHALAQVANFKCETNLKPINIRNALNSYLAQDIRIKQVKEVAVDFHARFNAQSKLYRYIILNSPTNSVFYPKLCWWIPYKLDFPLMHRASKIFLGRHNFKAFTPLEKAAVRERSSLTGFTAVDRKRKSDNFVRTVKRITLKKQRDFIILDIEADGFLYNMVRNIVGTLVEVGREKFSLENLKQILLSGNRKLAGPTAPASGLFLVKVRYREC